MAAHKLLSGSTKEFLDSGRLGDPYNAALLDKNVHYAQEKKEFVLAKSNPKYVRPAQI